MTFNIIGIDIYFKEDLYGFWIGAIKTEDIHRALFSIYYDRGWRLYLFWFTPIYFWEKEK